MSKYAARSPGRPQTAVAPERAEAGPPAGVASEPVLGTPIAIVALVPRSSRHDVRNPMIALPEVMDFARLPPGALEAMRVALHAISKVSRVKAEALWKSKKAVSAAYWKAKSVDSRHLALAIKRLQPRASPTARRKANAIAQSSLHPDPQLPIADVMNLGRLCRTDWDSAQGRYIFELQDLQRFADSVARSLAGGPQNLDTPQGSGDSANAPPVLALQVEAAMALADAYADANRPPCQTALPGQQDANGSRAALKTFLERMVAEWTRTN